MHCSVVARLALGTQHTRAARGSAGLPLPPPSSPWWWPNVWVLALCACCGAMPRAAGKPARKKAKAAPKKAKAAPKAVPKAKETVESLFERFCSAQDDSSAAGVEGQTRIGPEGIEAWTGALGVEPSDRRVLLFCWHARAAQMGYFTKEEWSRGFAACHAKTMAGLKRGLKTLDRTVEDPDDFEEFFEYAFDYCLTGAGER